jgi:nucleotide-binding universal stress UspA family protein
VLLEATCPIFAIGPSGASGVKNEAENEAEQDGRGSCFDFPYKQVLWPTDWSESSESALEEAVAIAAHHGAQLLMLHVIELPELAIGGWTGEHYAEAETRFDALCARNPGTCNARRLISRGVPAAEIKRVAVEEGADLIVMSTHGRTGWKQLKLGSVAQKVLRYVPCPVFLVPPHAVTSTAKMVVNEPVISEPQAAL